MKKTYLKPTVNVENAQPASLLCESFTSNVGLTPGGGSADDARAQEWSIWGEDE